MADENTIPCDNPVEMSRQLVQNYKPQLFFRSRFKAVTHATSSVLIDIQEKTRHISPYVRDDLPGTPMNRDGYKTISFSPPHLAPTRNITKKDLEQRLPGQNIVEISADTDSQESIEVASRMNDMLDLQSANERREEEMCAESLFSGKIVVKGGGYDETMEQPIPAEHIANLSGKSLFSAAECDPIAFLRGSRRRITKKGALSASTAVFGSDAFDAFIANAKVKAFLDNQRIDFGSIAPRQDQIYPGADYQGTILGMDLFTYDEYYFDEESKTEKPMVPVDRVLLIGRDCRMEMHYAAIYDAALGSINKTAYYAYNWITQGRPRGKWMCVESAPMPVLVQGGGIFSSKVV